VSAFPFVLLLKLSAMKRRRQQQITMRADAGGGFRFGFGFESVTAGRKTEEPEARWKLGGGGVLFLSQRKRHVV